MRWIICLIELHSIFFTELWRSISAIHNGYMNSLVYGPAWFAVFFHQNGNQMFQRVGLIDKKNPILIEPK